MSAPRILAISTMRNEGPYLPEWLAHHIGAGVSDFLIYSNDCEDGTDAMLDALAAAGVVEHVRNPGGARVQWRALQDAGRRAVTAAADWIMVIDADEFVNLRAPLDTLGDLVAAVGDAEAVVLPWRLFGSGGAARAGPAATTTRFTRAAPQPCAYPVAASFFKTLYRREGRFHRPGIHRPRQPDPARHGPARWVDGSGRRLPAGFAAHQERISTYGLPPASALVQLNHYSLRSAEEFMVKRTRGLPNRGRALDLGYWVERNLNAETDASIARMAPQTARAMAGLLAIPGLAALHEQARAWHGARFAALMGERAEWQFYGRLLLAGPSAPLPAAQARALFDLHAGGEGADD